MAGSESPERLLGIFPYGCCVPTSTFMWMLLVLFFAFFFLLIMCCVFTALTNWLYTRRLKKKMEELEKKYSDKNETKTQEIVVPIVISTEQTATSKARPTKTVEREKLVYLPTATPLLTKKTQIQDRLSIQLATSIVHKLASQNELMHMTGTPLEPRSAGSEEQQEWTPPSERLPEKSAKGTLQFRNYEAELDFEGITEEEPLEEQPTQEASKDEEEQREKLPPKQPVKTVVTKKDLQNMKEKSKVEEHADPYEGLDFDDPPEDDEKKKEEGLPPPLSKPKTTMSVTTNTDATKRSVPSLPSADESTITEAASKDKRFSGFFPFYDQNARQTKETKKKTAQTPPETYYTPPEERRTDDFRTPPSSYRNPNMAPPPAASRAASSREMTNKQALDVYELRKLHEAREKQLAKEKKCVA